MGKLFERIQESELIFKNVSAHELNINTDELFERFKQGDESRSHDGRELGLLIAKSIIELHHGTIEIQIVGDLFKAIITLPQNMH